MSEQREAKLSLSQLVWIATGQVVGAGVVTIVGSALAVTGYSAWFAYSAAVIMGTVAYFAADVFLQCARGAWRSVWNGNKNLRQAVRRIDDYIVSDQLGSQEERQFCQWEITCQRCSHR